MSRWKTLQDTDESPVCFSLPKYLRKRIVLYCAEHDLKQKEFYINAIESYLSMNKEGESDGRAAN